VRREIVFRESTVGHPAFSPDGELIAAATSFRGDRAIVRIIRLRTKREVQTMETHGSGISALTFTPDGKQIVAGMTDTPIVIGNLHSSD